MTSSGQEGTQWFHLVKMVLKGFIWLRGYSMVSSGQEGTQ